MRVNWALRVSRNLESLIERLGASMASFVFLFEALPLEVFTRIVGFAAAKDLFALSHVNSALLKELLEPDSEAWQRFLPVREITSQVSAKQSYFTRRPVRFPGRDHDAQGLRDHAGAVTVPNTVASRCKTRSFSMSLWFVMESSPTNGYAGGILFGAQSTRWSEDRWADNHKQFIQVDTRGNLYCSAIHEFSKEIVASGLEHGRWYHLVLTCAYEEQTQRVYLNGDLVHSKQGSPNGMWNGLWNWQLGSGFRSGGQGEPEPDFWGWYGFRGLIDDFTVRERVLTPEEIQLLKAGAKTVENGVGDQDIVWSLRQAQRFGTLKLLGGAKQLGFVAPPRSFRFNSGSMCIVNSVLDGLPRIGDLRPRRTRKCQCT